MRAYDFGFQLTVESKKQIATGVYDYTGTCYDGKRTFTIDAEYAVGDYIYVMGYIVMDELNVIKHGFIHK